MNFFFSSFVPIQSPISPRVDPYLAPASPPTTFQKLFELDASPNFIDECIQTCTRANCSDAVGRVGRLLLEDLLVAVLGLENHMRRRHGRLDVAAQDIVAPEVEELGDAVLYEVAYLYVEHGVEFLERLLLGLGEEE